MTRTNELKKFNESKIIILIVIQHDLYPDLFGRLQNCRKSSLFGCRRSEWCLTLVFCCGWYWSQQIWRLTHPRSLAHSPEFQICPLQMEISRGTNKKRKKRLKNRLIYLHMLSFCHFKWEIIKKYKLSIFTKKKAFWIEQALIEINKRSLVGQNS